MAKILPLTEMYLMGALIDIHCIDQPTVFLATSVMFDTQSI